MKTLALLAALMFCSLTCWGQPSPDTVWTSLITLPREGCHGRGVAPRGLSFVQGRILVVMRSECWFYDDPPHSSAGVAYAVLDTDGHVLHIRENGGVSYPVSSIPDAHGLIVLGPPGISVCKIDTSLEVAWEVHYDDAQNPYFAGQICRSADGGIFVCGRVDSNRSPQGNVGLLMKLRNDGTIVWQRSYRSIQGVNLGVVAFKCIDATNNGGVIIGGTAFPDQDWSMVARADSLGNFEWITLLDTSYTIPEVRDICRTSNGNIVTSGHHQNFLLAKLSASGGILWTGVGNDQRIWADGIDGTWGLDETHFIHRSATGGIWWTRPITYLGGHNTGSFELLVIDDRYLISGIFWHQQGDYGTRVALTGQDHTLGAIPENKNAAIVLSIGINSHPNPFNPSTTISFSIERPEHARVAVYDLTGREVSTLADKQFERGEHSLTFDGSALPSGIYFARLQSESGLAKTVKMALVK